MAEPTPAGPARDEPLGAAAGPADDSAEVLSRLAADSRTRYQVQAEVARGGQGAILRVWDEQLRRHLAMKVSLGRATASPPATPATGPAAPGTVSAPPPADARSVGRFLEEAQVTSQLDHPGIVPVHELGLDDQGRIFFTMKLVRGEDLGTVFARVHAGEPGWTTPRVVSLLLRACEALSYAHSRRVIHRDLKPANIMVGRYGEVFVMDWGLARVLDRADDKDVRVRPPEAGVTTAIGSDRRRRAAVDPESPLVTMDGDVVGTPAFMSPEQAAGNLELMGPPSDVYALGAMLYQLLTGRMPYITPGARVNNYAVLSRVQEGPPASVTSLAPRAPAELVAICEKAMAREPADRYPDMSALADDLRAWLEGRVVTAYETGAVAELRKWVVRNRPLASALAAGVLLLVGGLTASLVFKARSDRNAALAEAKTKDVLSLSAIQELANLVERADGLWPASPERLADFDAWLNDARVLVDGSPAHPGLKDHAAKLAELRARAKPRSPEQVESERRAQPRFAEWDSGRQKLNWMRRMLGQESWPGEADVEAELARETLPEDSNHLNHLAWTLVDPEASELVYGSEVRALLLSRRAIAVDGQRFVPEDHDTLSWALFRCGRLDEALAEEQRAADGASGTIRDEVLASQRRLQEQVALWTGDAERARRGAEASELAAQNAALAALIDERGTYEFADPRDAWWHAQLTDLVGDLNDFVDPRIGLDSFGTAPGHGWGIPRRAEFARTLDERSVSGADAKRRWSEAIDAIATSPLYDGLALKPQLGLLPIGADPLSGRWEFWHLASGDEPTRGPDGSLEVADSMGLVLVLIPGGTFWMGDQKTDPAGRHYDPNAADDEGPVHAVSVSPFLLSKFEMTQSQWERFTGSNPSGEVPGWSIARRRITPRHPVTHVSWNEAMLTLPKLGLVLPTEAQWERAARGGTETRWSSGDEKQSLEGAVNIADQSATKAGAIWKSVGDWPELNDGWASTSPVGSYRANPYGLHDCHGNVEEWCRDAYDRDYYAESPERDPCRGAEGRRNGSSRGGGYEATAWSARSAQRNGHPRETGSSVVGLRPARELER